MTSRIPFLSSVLADEGMYCIVGLKKGAPRQTFVETVEEIDGVVDGLIAQGFDAYFGCAKYLNASEGRTAKNAKWFKAFWLDLDCGEGKPYETQSVALDALKQFVTDTGLPRPTIVNSGRGVHVYWILATPIFYNDWKPTAEAFKKFCAAYHLHADPSVTADAARILRVPETLNYKDSPPVPVDVMLNSQPITFDRFRAIVGAGPEEEDDVDGGLNNVLPFPAPVHRRPIDATTRALMGNSVSRFGTIMRKSAQGKGCTQLVRIYKDQQEIDEPLWRAGLSIAVNCEDGELAIHKISHGHDEYDPQDTKRKADSLLGKPYKCATFGSLYPEGCADCPNKGTITSPIQIGAQIAEAKAEDNIVVMRNATLEEEITVEIPEYPFPYFRGKNGGVYKRGLPSAKAKAKGKEDEETEEERDHLIYEYDFYVVKRLTDPDAGESLWMRLHMPKDGIREFSAPLASILSKDKFREVLAYQGVTAYNKKLDGLMAYVTRWVNELQQLSEAEKARQQFGWCDNDTKFVVGNREITATGVNYSPSSAATLELASMYQKKGTVSEWAKVANNYARKGNEVRAFTLFAGFGSTLFKFTKLSGAIIHLTNNSSGTGKTTIQYMVNSIWGRPLEIMMNQEDKYLARMHRISVMGNLPPTIDELTNMADEEVSNMGYGITHGRGRNRMQSQVNAERSNVLRWALIAITSGNKSLYDQLFNLKDFPEGELMRILEFNVSKNDSMTKAESDEAFIGMYENFGVAGEVFMRYVIANLPEVKKMLGKIQRKLDKAAGLTQRERFWSATAACAITSGIITKKLGLHDIDVAAVYEWIVATLKRMRVEIRPGVAGPLAHLGLFLNENNNNMLIVNSTVDKRSGLLEAPVREPRGELITRFEPDTKLLFVTVKLLREWCSKNQVSYKGLVDELETMGACHGVLKKAMSRGSDMSTPAVSALVIDCRKATALDPEEPSAPVPSNVDLQ
jgi:hypothetical protein